MRILQNLILFLTISLALLLAYQSTFGAARIRHEALLEAFGGADTHAIETKQEIAKLIPKFLTAEFYSKDLSTRNALGTKFWKAQILPKARSLDPDYIIQLRRKFYKACHA